MTLTEKITHLCSLAAPSGFEDAAFRAVKELLAPLADEIVTDSMGNLMAFRRCGRPGAKTLLLDAHMDEIGFIVTGIEKGFLRFDTLGGVDPRMLPAAEVQVLCPEPLFGVIDTMPPHILTAEEMDKTVAREKLFIDAGLSQEAAEKRVPLGTPAVFISRCTRLGEKQLSSKALDDRACAAILIQVLEDLRDKALNVDLCCMISTQEEVGLRGAKTGIFRVNPDYAVAVDVTHAHTPDAKKEETLPLGKGAAVGVGPNMNRALTRAVFACGEKRGIPCQTEVIPGDSGTNGWVFQVSREGVPTAVVSLPIKYMHTPVETMHIDDAQAVCDLLKALAEDFEEVLS